MPKPQKKRSFVTASATITAGLMIAVSLSACAMATIKKTWREPGMESAVYHKLLIIGIAHDDNVRVMFEDILADTLRQHGVEAVSSHTLISDLSKADRDLVQKVAQNEGADGVIITRGLSKSERTVYQFATGTLQVRTAVTQDVTENSRTNIAMSAVGIAPTTTGYELASLETQFFDTAGAKLVWLALSDTSQSGERVDAVWELSSLLVQELAKEQLVKINDKKFSQPVF